jgi:hypothetical protein
MISMYSRRRVSGFSYEPPYQPSTTCGPDGPRPIRKRPSESWSSVIAVIAAIVGARAASCMIAVPALILVVLAKMYAAVDTASEPYASAVQHESKPSFSASRIMGIGRVSLRPE